MIKNVILIAGCGIAVVVAACSVSECIKQRKKTIQKRRYLEALEIEYAFDNVKRRLEEQKAEADIEDENIRKLIRKANRMIEMG